jgi:hypothetical protein
MSWGHGELTKHNGRGPGGENENLYTVLVAVATAYSMVFLPKGWTQQGKYMSPVSCGKTVICDIQWNLVASFPLPSFSRIYCLPYLVLELAPYK